MSETKVLRACVVAIRVCSKWAYVQARVVECDPDGGHYLNSRGATTLWASRPYRSSAKARRVAEAMLAEIQRQRYAYVI